MPTHILSFALLISVAVLPVGQLQALTVSINDQRVLVIQGTPQNDHILLRLDSQTQSAVEVDDPFTAENPDYSIQLANVDRVQVLAGPGDDLVALDDSNGDLTTLRPVELRGGSGDNTLLGSTAGLTLEDIQQRLARVRRAEESLRASQAELAALFGLVQSTTQDIMANEGALTASQAVDFFETLIVEVDQAATSLADQAADMEAAYERSRDIEARALAFQDTGVEYAAQANALLQQVNAFHAQAQDLLLDAEQAAAEATNQVFAPGTVLADRLDPWFAQMDKAESLPGDANRDDVVDALDFEIWRAHALQGQGTLDRGDFDGNTITDGRDLMIWQNHYQKRREDHEDAQTQDISDQMDDALEVFELAVQGFAAQINRDLQGSATNLALEVWEQTGRTAENLQGEVNRIVKEEAEAWGDQILGEMNGHLARAENRVHHEIGSSLDLLGQKNATLGQHVQSVSEAFRSKVVVLLRQRITAAFNAMQLAQANIEQALAPFQTGGQGAVPAMAAVPMPGCNVPGTGLVATGCTVCLGTPGSDVLVGTAANDILIGRDANDHLDGLGGNDLLWGGSGRDEILGGAGDDIALGDDGDDCIFGNAGSDLLLGGADDDHIEAGPGGGLLPVDILFGDDGHDTLLGGIDSDLLVGGADNDTLDGDAGVDLLVGWSGLNTLIGGGGTNVTLGALNTMDLGDIMLGGTDPDTFLGGPDIDIMYGDTGTDTMTAGTGGNLTLQAGALVLPMGSIMMGGPNADTMTGSDQIDVLVGDPGADTIDAGGGQVVLLPALGGLIEFGDIIHGGDDADVLNGEGFIDLIFGGSGHDTQIDGGPGGTIVALTTIEFGNVLSGDAGNDVLVGGDRIDVLLGGSDDDVLTGGGGRSLTLVNGVTLANLGDFYAGGSGIDTLNGSDDIDFMFGGADNDSLFGLNGGSIVLTGGVIVIPVNFGNVMVGDAGEDILEGGDDRDILSGGPDGDDCFGLGEIDFIIGGDGDDLCEGGLNIDFIWAGNDADILRGQENIDFLFCGDGPDEASGEENIDFIWGGDGHDNPLTGEDNIDFIFGGDGQDVIDGGANIDFLFGGDQEDTLTGGLNIDFIFGGDGSDVMNGNENIDFMFGGKGGDVISGGINLDMIFGEDGPDTINGNGGVDLIFGQGGADTISGDDESDLIFGGTGNDKLFGGNGNDMIFGNEGGDCIEGNAQADFLFGGDGPDEMRGHDGIDLMLGEAGADVMFGGDASDVMFGATGNDEMHGGNGIELIFLGGDGADKMFGGDGGDLIIGEGNNDQLYGDGGKDWIFGFTGDDCIFGGEETDNVYGGQDDDFIYGEGGEDKLHGNRGNDVIHGGGGADKCTGNRGDDHISGGPGNDKLTGDRNDDTIVGDGGEDKIYGNDGADLLDGGDEADKVRGGNGGDVVYGGNGADDVGGGLGADDVCDDCQLGVDCCAGDDIIPEAECAEIHGIKWEDLDGNATFDEDENGLPGWRIYVDLNDNDIYDAGEPYDFSMEDDPATCPDETGRYWITGLPPGEYTVREELIDDSIWEQTFPGEPEDFEHHVDLKAGEILQEIDFGNHPFYSICGIKWHDENGNGQRDMVPVEEPPLQGVPIYLDLNTNGVWEVGEPIDITNVDGEYCLAVAEAGIYTVREIPPPEYYQTFPEDGEGHVVEVELGVNEPYDFGNAMTGSVTGSKFLYYADDYLGPLGGVTVYVDYDNDKTLDTDEPRGVTDQVTGRYTIYEVMPGTWKVREIVPEDTIQIFPFLPPYHTVPVTSGETTGDWDFHNQPVD